MPDISMQFSSGNGGGPVELVGVRPSANQVEQPLTVRVNSIAYEGDFINAYEVVDSNGGELPPFSAGSHIDVALRDGTIRQYSLCNDPEERSRYVFAVQREDKGRGGSRAIFQQLHVGSIVAISQPRNNFPLNERALSHLLLAGGIGITPMMAMIHRLSRIGANFKLHYCTRTQNRTAFRRQLQAFVGTGQVEFHHDEGDRSRSFDLVRALTRPKPQCHVYCCGPSAFVDAALSSTAHWPPEAIHVERFSVAAPQISADASGVAESSFHVKLRRSGILLEVPADKSIVQVLREHGVEVPTSCEAGLCGTCRTPYVDGVPEHHDFVLSDDERQRDVLICCARARTPTLVLDI
jgi:vanillate O-demethylase ferredoxin subunit